MPWGKFKGLYVDGLPGPYFDWLMLNLDTDIAPPALVKAVRDEAVRRQTGNDLGTLADRWFDEMIDRFPNGKKVLNHGRTLLEELIERMNDAEAEPLSKPVDGEIPF
jgi:hypothetical protein